MTTAAVGENGESSIDHDAAFGDRGTSERLACALAGALHPLRGVGRRQFQESHGGPYGSETMFDPCDNLAVTQCHRCGVQGLTEDGEGPCSACGWDHDDGAPGG